VLDRLEHERTVDALIVDGQTRIAPARAHEPGQPAQTRVERLYGIGGAVDGERSDAAREQLFRQKTRPCAEIQHQAGERYVAPRRADHRVADLQREVACRRVRIRREPVPVPLDVLGSPDELPRAKARRGCRRDGGHDTCAAV
jgi:hypothetical protein